MEFKTLAEYKLLNHDILALQNEVKLTNTKGKVLNIKNPYCVNKLLLNTVLNENGCWVFTGRKNYRGYGEISVCGANLKTHRLSYYYFYRQNPGDLLVLHSCDRPTCIFPGHLSLGTNDDNMREAAERYRMCRGEANNKTRFSNKEVVEIVKRYNELRNYLAVAKEFNCSDFCIKQIVNSPTRTREAGLDAKELLSKDNKSIPLQNLIKPVNAVSSMGGNSKLTWDKVNQIREDYKTIKSPIELSRIHNVCRKTIAKIVRNKIWVINETTLNEQRQFSKEEIQLMADRYVVLKSYAKVAAELNIGINRVGKLLKTI